MKKLSLLIGLLAISVLTLFPQQTRVITGTVTSAVEGEGPLAGVTVLVKGTTIGTATDVNGKYTLNVPVDAKTLVFSFIGMKTLEVEIAGRSVVDVVMESETVGLAEIVVTSGYGIRRAPKSSSSLTQVVSGDRLNEVRPLNVNNALAGKVSGIQFQGQSAAKLGAAGNIRLRGGSGFGEGSGVLYVVDGTILPNANDLNLDDIEDISVLSGPSASAILGDQGANGAIIITTKKARVSAGKTMGIEANLGFLASSVYVLPNYQNDYAGGAYYDLQKYEWKPGHPEEWKALDGKYYHNYSDDASWGPRMAGQEYIPWYAWYGGHKYSYKTAKLLPQPNNARDFYETGFTYNNSVAFSKVSEGFNIRATLGNLYVDGLIPTTYLNRTNFSVKTSYDLTKRLTFAANVNFFTTFTNGEFDDGYSNQTTGSFNQWFHRDLDMKIMKELKDVRTPDGIWASWNHNDPTVYDPANPRNFYAANYWYNFYKYFDLVTNQERRDRLFGDVSLSYKIIEGLNFKVTYRRQQNNRWYEEKYSSDLNYSGTQTTGNEPRYKGYYRTETSYSNRENYETLLSFSRKFGDFNVNANAGTDFFNSVLKSNRANTVDGLNVANLYTIANSKSQPNIVNDRQNYKYRAAFLRGDVGFRDFLFGEFTLRNDWYSTLPPNNNSILSKSFGGSFVFSDLLQIPFLNFGKIRASWGEIPRSIGVYEYPGFEYGVGQYQWTGNFLMGTPDRLVDPNIHGAVNTQKELGLELRFLKSRIGLTATYWDGSERDIPVSVTISSFSGFTTKLVNTGEMIKKGIDLSLNFKPFDTPKFSWEINTTWAYLIKQEVTKIAEGIDRITVQNQGWDTPYLVHAINKPWGEIFGSGMKVDEKGRPYLTKSGSYVKEAEKYYGNVLPKYTGGIQNSFKILKDISVTANFDYQVGGKFFSLSDMWGCFSGLMARTSGLNDKGIPIRDPVADGGGVRVDGVDVDTGEPVTYYVDAQEYFHNLWNNDIYDSFIYDLTYFKFREFSIGYNVPLNKIGLSRYIQSATISLVAQNFWLIYSSTKDFDPSEVARAGGESGQFPGIRSIGTNIRITF
ncbi:MAG TPA: SusC/RagA family TonB-linked outer membrane protein [Bacteroidales bacterium]|mgnify:CR=1 FL=1|nr:SusC/RagA family TonB-linked outer membrane protein [Bacteroidales bacterium]